VGVRELPGKSPKELQRSADGIVVRCGGSLRFILCGVSLPNIIDISIPIALALGDAMSFPIR
jgi:hypothetical protein